MEGDPCTDRTKQDVRREEQNSKNHTKDGDVNNGRRVCDRSKSGSKKRASGGVQKRAAGDKHLPDLVLDIPASKKSRQDQGNKLTGRTDGFRKEAFAELEAAFLETRNPKQEQLQALGEKIGKTAKEVSNWFARRRIRATKEYVMNIDLASYVPPPPPPLPPEDFQMDDSSPNEPSPEINLPQTSAKVTSVKNEAVDLAVPRTSPMDTAPDEDATSAVHFRNKNSSVETCKQNQIGVIVKFKHNGDAHSVSLPASSASFASPSETAVPQKTLQNVRSTCQPVPKTTSSSNSPLPSLAPSSNASSFPYPAGTKITAATSSRPAAVTHSAANMKTTPFRNFSNAESTARSRQSPFMLPPPSRPPFRCPNDEASISHSSFANPVQREPHTPRSTIPAIPNTPNSPYAGCAPGQSSTHVSPLNKKLTFVTPSAPSFLYRGPSGYVAVPKRNKPILPKPGTPGQNPESGKRLDYPSGPLVPTTIPKVPRRTNDESVSPPSQLSDTSSRASPLQEISPLSSRFVANATETSDDRKANRIARNLGPVRTLPSAFESVGDTKSRVVTTKSLPSCNPEVRPALVTRISSLPKPPPLIRDPEPHQARVKSETVLPIRAPPAPSAAGETRGPMMSGRPWYEPNLIAPKKLEPHLPFRPTSEQVKRRDCGSPPAMIPLSWFYPEHWRVQEELLGYPYQCPQLHNTRLPLPVLPDPSWWWWCASEHGTYFP